MKEIPGHEGYFATASGEIYSLRSSEPRLLMTRNNKGYLVVNFTVGSGRSKYRMRMPVHRAVALAFHGVPPEGKSNCCHRNGNSLDNRAENLYWGSRQENYRDAVLHGSFGCGERAPNCRLRDEEIEQIKRRRASGDGARQLAREFGISDGYVYRRVQRASAATTCYANN